MAEKFIGLENTKDPIDYVTFDTLDSADFYSSSEEEVIELIRNLKTKKACGYDLISNNVLKATCNTIVPFITRLYNVCIDKGVFPDCFKIAQVIPLFKGGNKEDPSCYRPISLLPALGKLLEKIVSVRALEYFNENDILSKHQFGFRKGFSTEYAILDIYEKLLSNLDQKLSTCAIFLDLVKALHSVDHSILLRKLSKYGIRENFLNFFHPTWNLDPNLSS